MELKRCKSYEIQYFAGKSFKIEKKVIKIEDSSSDESSSALPERQEFSLNASTYFDKITWFHPKPTPTKRKLSDKNVQNPKYRKPFLYGWKRELVYRATVHDIYRKGSDVYYITPRGEKLRSMVQVLDYLKENQNQELTEEHFNFWNKPLGLKNSELEIIRYATRRNPRRQKKIRNQKSSSKKRVVVSPTMTRTETPPETPLTKRIANLTDVTVLKPKLRNNKIAKCFRAITDPELHKPFSHGWRREVIYRIDVSNDLKVETYYIAPTGTRVESKKALERYFKKNVNKELTTNNFTFCRGPLGLNDPKKEIIINTHLFKNMKRKGDIQQKKQPKLHETNKQEDNIIITDDLPPKSPPVVDNDPKFLKPFLFGWKRELVYRLKLSETNKYNVADTYYHTPSGEKCRSAKNVITYLLKTKCNELTADNFIFNSRPLGLDDPEKEIIRGADVNMSLRRAKRKYRTKHKCANKS